jgi:hypothetical protein
MTPTIQPELLPPAVAASSAYASDEITTKEYNDALHVAELEEAIKLPFCKATWGDVQEGDTVLVARFGEVVKVEIKEVERDKDSILVDYAIDGCYYHGVLYAPDQTTYIQQR